MRDLMSDYGYSLATVTKAIDTLEQGGLVARVHGKGVFVVESSVRQGVSLDDAVGATSAGDASSFLSIAVISGFPQGQRSADMWWAPISHGIESAVLEGGGRLRMVNVGRTMPARVVRQLQDQGIDGVINIGDHWKGRRLGEAADAFRDAGMPAVMAWSSEPRPLPISSIDVDNRRGIVDAFRHLTELNHGAISFLGYDSDLSWVGERQRAYVECAASAGMEPHIAHTCLGYALRDDREKIAGMLDVSTAIIAANDDAATAFIDAAAELGKYAPGDFSIVGFDDDVLYRPRELTTVRQDMEKIGREAVGLLSRLHAGAFGESTVQFHIRPELMVRHTTAECGTGNAE